MTTESMMKFITLVRKAVSNVAYHSPSLSGNFPVPPLQIIPNNTTYPSIFTQQIFIHGAIKNDHDDNIILPLLYDALLYATYLFSSDVDDIYALLNNRVLIHKLFTELESNSQQLTKLNSLRQGKTGFNALNILQKILANVDQENEAFRNYQASVEAQIAIISDLFDYFEETLEKEVSIVDPVTGKITFNEKEFTEFKDRYQQVLRITQGETHRYPVGTDFIFSLKRGLEMGPRSRFRPLFRLLNTAESREIYREDSNNPHKKSYILTDPRIHHRSLQLYSFYEMQDLSEGEIKYSTDNCLSLLAWKENRIILGAVKKINSIFASINNTLNDNASTSPEYNKGLLQLKELTEWKNGKSYVNVKNLLSQSSSSWTTLGSSRYELQLSVEMYIYRDNIKRIDNKISVKIEKCSSTASKEKPRDPVELHNAIRSNSFSGRPSGK